MAVHVYIGLFLEPALFPFCFIFLKKIVQHTWLYIMCDGTGCYIVKFPPGVYY